MELSRQEYWSGLPFPSPGDLPGIKPGDPLHPDSWGPPVETGWTQLSLKNRHPGCGPPLPHFNQQFLSYTMYKTDDFPGGPRGKEPTCQCRRCRFDPCVGKIPLRRKWQATSVFLPGKSHRQRSLMGYSLWGCTVKHNLSTKQHQFTGFEIKLE